MNPKLIQNLLLGAEAQVTITWKGFFHRVPSSVDLHCYLAVNMHLPHIHTGSYRSTTIIAVLFS